jgi:hypothetical protein
MNISNDVISGMLFTLADIEYRGAEGAETAERGVEALSSVYTLLGGTYFCGFIAASSGLASAIVLQAIFNSCNFERTTLLAVTTSSKTAVNLLYRSKQV